MSRLGVACQCVAPTSAPMNAGDLVETDRRDVVKLARGDQAGHLTHV